MVDISKCYDLIPEIYKQTHDYLPEVNQHRLNMPSGRIPYDLAFSRWCGVEKGVTMMPCSFFYKVGSQWTDDKYVRLALCKDRASIELGVQRLRERMA